MSKSKKKSIFELFIITLQSLQNFFTSIALLRTNSKKEQSKFCLWMNRINCFLKNVIFMRISCFWNSGIDLCVHSKQRRSNVNLTFITMRKLCKTKNNTTFPLFCSKNGSRHCRGWRENILETISKDLPLLLPSLERWKAAVGRRKKTEEVCQSMKRLFYWLAC